MNIILQPVELKKLDSIADIENLVFAVYQRFGLISVFLSSRISCGMVI